MNDKIDKKTAVSRSRSMTCSADAVIFTPYGEKRGYFQCANCNRVAIFTLPENRCPKCGNDTFRLIGFFASK
ncbi:MAG: hypothetical protein ACR2N3_15540 [Pyrinomonadaceae bacterium]